jgi:hypothetical protein
MTHETECPYCGNKVIIQFNKLVPILPDSERCESKSIPSGFRCTKKRGHEGNHEHYPFVWRNISRVRSANEKQE